MLAYKNTIAIIPAGGSGKRMKADIPKQFLELRGVPIIIRTIDKLHKSKMFSKIIIPTHFEWIDFIKENLESRGIDIPVFFVPNGKERQDSIYNALISPYCASADYVLIHDAVRPKLSVDLIKRVVKEVHFYNAVIPVIPAKDTIKIVDKNGFVFKTLDRDKLRIVQTPQAFSYIELRKAYEQVMKLDKVFTDDSAIAEHCGISVKTIEGEERNIKITTPEDME